MMTIELTIKGVIKQFIRNYIKNKFKQILNLILWCIIKFILNLFNIPEHSINTFKIIFDIIYNFYIYPAVLKIVNYISIKIRLYKRY